MLAANDGPCHEGLGWRRADPPRSRPGTGPLSPHSSLKNPRSARRFAPTDTTKPYTARPMTTSAAATPCRAYHADRSVVSGARDHTIEVNNADTVARSPNRPTSTARISAATSAHDTLSGLGSMPEYWTVTTRT